MFKWLHIPFLDIRLSYWNVKSEKWFEYRQSQMHNIYLYSCVLIYFTVLSGRCLPGFPSIINFFFHLQSRIGKQHAPENLRYPPTGRYILILKTMQIFISIKTSDLMYRFVPHSGHLLIFKIITGSSLITF
jgi:hypothetical protein